MLFIVNCRQLLLLRRFYISDGHPLRNSILFGLLMLFNTLPAKPSLRWWLFFLLGWELIKKQVKISRCQKSRFDFKRATDSQVGGVYFMVLNSQPFWLVLRSQKCVLENFGSNLEGSELSGKRLFCGQTLVFFSAKLFVKSSESLNIGRMNQ